MFEARFESPKGLSKVIRESATCRWLNRFVSNHSGSDSDSALCRADVNALLTSKSRGFF